MKPRVFAPCLVLLTAWPGWGWADKANYERPFEPPTHPAFLALPPGAVEPRAWLRDWCLAARDGFTGHMDEYHEEFRRAWAADHTMTGERLNWPKGGWPYEGGGYWFDGLARLGYALHDESLVTLAKQRLGVVVDRVNPNSVLFMWWLDRTKPDDVKGSLVAGGWPVWANGLLGRAMTGYYAGSGDPRVLQCLELAYGSERDWLQLGWASSNPWPAFDTYTWTGNQQIAAALTSLFSQPGTQNPAIDRYRRMPDPKPGAEKNDHVVHFLETTTPWALGYLWTGKREYLDTALAWHDLLDRVAMQPSGVPVADEFYGPTGAYRGTETCDVAGYLWSQIALLTVCGQGRLADRAERAFFNAGPATVARDFKTHVYFQSPNRIVDRCPPYPHGPKAEGNSYAPTHYPLCCTAALNRIVPWYVTHMWLATFDNGLAAAHYGPCRVAALAGNRVPVEITCETAYPFDEVVQITVNPAEPATFPLSFRIPGWCAQPELTISGSPAPAIPDRNGFVRVERLWQSGDQIRLRFPMQPQICTGRDQNAKGAPFGSVSCGPLLFALPIPEAGGPNAPAPAAKWNYALDGSASGMRLARTALPAPWNWPLQAPLTLTVGAIPCQWSPTPEAPLPPAPVTATGQPAPLTLVPYGCTKFRVSMFPVTEQAWAANQAGSAAR